DQSNPNINERMKGKVIPEAPMKRNVKISDMVARTYGAVVKPPVTVIEMD
ncbi:33222_t:CDS:2, partial [Racocetra persica]